MCGLSSGEGVIESSLPANPFQEGGDAALEDYARLYIRWFWEGRLEPLWERFSEELRGIFNNSLDEFRSFWSRFHERAGQDMTILEAAMRRGDGYVRYRVDARGLDVFNMECKVRENGTIARFLVRPHGPENPAPTRFQEYRTLTELTLPFEGDWYVVSGGRTLEQNPHIRFQNQRFAYDFVIQREGRSHRGEGRVLGDYYCFGQPIFAPAGGRVAAAVETLPDNLPGERDYENILGNHVILDHGNGEFSFLVHLMQGSIPVSPGDVVVRGALLGLCGNSGNSREPHLHYHLQNNTDWRTGEGLPAQFQDYLADGRPVPRGEPLEGQTIRTRRTR